MREIKFKPKHKEENTPLKRPKCACGTLMTLVMHKGYYEHLQYWECDNPDCDNQKGFIPDRIEKGGYA